MNNVTNWVFDLDNTLYKAECGLFDKVHVLMGRYIEEKLGLASGEAQALRSKYYHQYGTTLRGLMMEHQIDPDDYLDYVHQINYDVVSPDGLNIDYEIDPIWARENLFNTCLQALFSIEILALQSAKVLLLRLSVITLVRTIPAKV